MNYNSSTFTKIHNNIVSWKWIATTRISSIFSELTTLISSLGFDIESFQGVVVDDSLGNKKGLVRCSIKIKNMEELNIVLNKIRAMKDVIDAQRY